jgi:hypothetical protein
MTDSDWEIVPAVGDTDTEEDVAEQPSDGEDSMRADKILATPLLQKIDKVGSDEQVCTNIAASPSSKPYNYTLNKSIRSLLFKVALAQGSRFMLHSGK